MNASEGAQGDCYPSLESDGKLVWIVVQCCTTVLFSFQRQSSNKQVSKQQSVGVLSPRIGVGTLHLINAGTFVSGEKSREKE